MRVGRIAAMTAFAGMGVVLIAVPSQAGLTTFCSGTASDVTVPGDLVVQAGESCDLTNVTIQGNATVRKDANLLLVDGTVDGNLVVQANGFAEVIGSTVAGATRLNQAYGVYTENAEHVGLVNANSPEFFYSVGSAHAGNVRSTGGETYLESARLAGNVTTTGNAFTDVVDTVVEGNLRVTGAESGSFVCASEIDGAATFAGNSEIVQLGGPDCDYGVFGANVVIQGNPAAQLIVGDNVIRGNLVCSGNDAGPVVTGNRVRGAAQCEGATTAAAPALSRSAQVDTEDRKAGILAKIDARTAAGERAAEQAGQAFGG